MSFWFRCFSEFEILVLQDIDGDALWLSAYNNNNKKKIELDVCM